MDWDGLGAACSVQRQVLSSQYHSNEPLVYIKCEEFFDLLSDSELPKNASDPCKTLGTRLSFAS
jgi:hypothetical protein